MAATDSNGRLLGSLVLAACALPGVMPAAQAEEAPEQGVIGLKYSLYRESQSGTGAWGTASGERTVSNGRARAYAVTAASGGGGGTTGGSGSDDDEGGFSRIHVNSPSIYALVPLGRRWSLEGSATFDAVSGASPAYYSDLSGASDMTDHRKAVDAKLTRYFDRQVLSVGAALSNESDYVSRAVSVEGRWASDDQNTTWNAGVGLTRDTIGKDGSQSKRTHEFQLGVTQALSRLDLLQAQVTVSRASGDLNDPYKYMDRRPGERSASIVQLRWNHWLGGSALHTGYRYYRDSFKVVAHTVDLAWVIPTGYRASFTPSVRYYTQTAASFYVDPSSDASIYPGTTGSPTYFSVDQRLSAFGALTLGGKIDWELTPGWSADLKLDWYHQASAWRLGGGSPGLVPLTGLTFQVGLSHRF